MNARRQIKSLQIQKKGSPATLSPDWRLHYRSPLNKTFEELFKQCSQNYVQIRNPQMKLLPNHKFMGNHNEINVYRIQHISMGQHPYVSLTDPQEEP